MPMDQRAFLSSTMTVGGARVVTMFLFVAPW